MQTPAKERLCNRKAVGPLCEQTQTQTLGTILVQANILGEIQYLAGVTTAN